LATAGATTVAEDPVASRSRPVDPETRFGPPLERSTVNKLTVGGAHPPGTSRSQGSEPFETCSFRLTHRNSESEVQSHVRIDFALLQREAAHQGDF